MANRHYGHHRHHSYQGNHGHCSHYGDDAGTGFLLFFAIIAIPLLGIYWAVAGETEEKKAIGAIICIISIIVWLCAICS